MKGLFLKIGALTVLLGMVTFMMTAEAALQDNFWAEVAQGNMTEIAASNVALERSQNEQVKQFAQQMVTEHTAMSTELQTLAASKNATVPTTLDSKHQSDVEKLGGKTGSDFDRDYMRMMVRDHDRMAKLLERESERNADADVKAFAAKSLPAVQGHLSMARTLNDSLRGNNNRGGNDNASNVNRSGNDNASNVNRSGNDNASNMNRSGNDNASNMNRSGNDNASNANRSGNMNMNGNSNDNRNSDNTGFSNLRPNVNREANSNANTNRNTNRNRNRNTNTNMNSNTNRNGNTNGNANNSNMHP